MENTIANITLTEIEKSYIYSLVFHHKNENPRAQAETKTSLIKFFKEKGLFSEAEIDQIERLVFETKVLRPNVIPTNSITEVINKKLRELEMIQL